MVLYETRRLLVRRFREKDWRDLYEYLSDAETVRYEPYEPYEKVQAQFEALARSTNNAFYGVELKETGKLIGNLYFEKQEYDTYELGYVFNKQFWRQGFAYESAYGLLDLAFSHMNARRVVAMCCTENLPSNGLLQKLGFRKEGTLLQNVAFKKDQNGDPIWFDTNEYGMLRPEWEAQKQNKEREE